MAVLTEARHAGEFIISEGNGHVSRDTVTIVAGSGIVRAGTVLGKITASGKYAPSPDTGATGEQVATAINIYEVDATADVTVAAVMRSAEVNGNTLTYAASVNDGTKKAAKATQLAAVGIIVR